MTRTERAGLAFALAEAGAVGLVPAFSKYVVASLDPLLYSAAAVTVAAFVSVAFASARGEAGQIFHVRWIPWLIPIALLGTTATTLLILYGARLTDGVSTALLLQIEPAYSIALAWVVHRNRAPARQLIGTALVILGVGFVLWDGSIRVGAGGVLILLVPLGWQLSHVLALRVMPPMSPYALTAARYVYGGGALVLAQLVFGTAPVSTLGARGAGLALFHGVVLFFCGTLFWYETIRRLELSRATAIVTPAEPLLSLILVWVVLGGLPNLWQMAGIALVLPGLWLVVRRKPPRP
jgi:drug/metabolite transporter (DMT)-like permease